MVVKLNMELLKTKPRTSENKTILEFGHFMKVVKRGVERNKKTSHSD